MKEFDRAKRRPDRSYRKPK